MVRRVVLEIIVDTGLKTCEFRFNYDDVNNIPKGIQVGVEQSCSDF